MGIYSKNENFTQDKNLIKESILYSHKFKDKTVYFRSLGHLDETALQDFFASHKPETIYQRYLMNVQALPHEVAQARVCIDYHCCLN